MDLSAHDSRETYCRMLGHDVPFGYCRAVTQGLPCRRIADCWFTQLDVTAWLEANYTPEQVARFTAPPPPKLTSILDLIQKARSGEG